MSVHRVNTSNYNQMVRSLSVSLDDFLSSKVFADAGGTSDAPIVLNQAQRGSAWENKEVRELMGALYGDMLYDDETRERALQATRGQGSNIYDADDPERLPPYINGIKIHGVEENQGKPRKKHEGKPYEIIDGQQRSFALRTMCVWLLAKGARLSGALDPSLLDVLMRKEDGRRVPRVNFDLEENNAGSWPAEDGSRIGALNHLLVPLTGSSRVNPTVIADQIYTRIERDIKKAAKFSAQSTNILRVFKAMDNVWDTFADSAAQAGEQERLDALTMGLLQASITVSMTSPHMNPEIMVRIDNCSGKHFVEIEKLRAILVENAREDPNVAKIAQRLAADAMALGSKQTEDVILTTYWVAMAMATDDITPLALFGGDEKTKDKLEELLNRARQPDQLAKKIAQHLPAAFEAVCLAKHGRLPPGVKSRLPDDIQQALVSHSTLSVRGFVAGAAWLALGAPEQARQLIPFVNLATAGNQAVGGLLPKIKAAQNGGTMVRYSYTTKLDSDVIRWTQLVKNAKTAKIVGAQTMFEVLSTGRSRPYAAINPADIVTLFESIANPKERKSFRDLAIDKKKQAINATYAPLFQSLLGISQAQIEAGVELVEGGELIGVFPGRSRGSEISSPSALKINVSTSGLMRLKKTRRDIMGPFGGEFDNKAELFSERMEKTRRLEGREEGIKQLIKIQLLQWQQKGADINSASKEQQLATLKSKANGLAECVRSKPQWERLVQSPSLVDLAYRKGIQNMEEKEQQAAVKAILLGARRTPDIQTQASSASKPEEVVRARSPRR
jgi:hypothetical protein